jgi:hypothetical protein
LKFFLLAGLSLMMAPIALPIAIGVILVHLLLPFIPLVFRIVWAILWTAIGGMSYVGYLMWRWLVVGWRG